MSAKVKFLWREQEFIRAPNYTNLFDKHHNNYQEFEGKHWIELNREQQKHWEKLGCDLCHAFDAARRGAEAGCLSMPVLFDLPEPDVPLAGRVSTTKKKPAKKPYERKASGASTRRKPRRKQSAPIEPPPVVSVPQDEMFEMPVQYEGLQPFGFPEPIQYTMPLLFDVPIPQYPMMAPADALIAPDFDPYCGAQAVMDNIYNETIMRLFPEGPLLPSYPDEIPQEWTPPGNLTVKAE